MASGGPPYTAGSEIPVRSSLGASQSFGGVARVKEDYSAGHADGPKNAAPIAGGAGYRCGQIASDGWLVDPERCEITHQLPLEHVADALEIVARGGHQGRR